MKTSTLPRQQLKRLLASQDEIRAWIDVNGCLVIGIGMLKGGTGKTTLTIFTALYLALILGLKVLVIDTDDNSQTVDNWLKVRENRGEEIPFSVTTYDAQDDSGLELDDLIDSFRGDFDVIIVDSGGAGKEAYWELCQSANLVLLPFAPSGFEWNRIPPTAKTAARGGKANPNRLKLFACMVKCTGRNTLAADARPVVEVLMDTAIDADTRRKIDVFFVSQDFEISESPEYPRAWAETPKRTHLEEVGLLFRHAMKEVVA